MKKIVLSLVLLLTLIISVGFSAGAADASGADYMEKYTLDDYSTILKKLGYCSFYDENSTTAPDDTVFYYHLMNDKM